MVPEAVDDQAKPGSGGIGDNLDVTDELPSSGSLERSYEQPDGIRASRIHDRSVALRGFFLLIDPQRRRSLSHTSTSGTGAIGAWI
jgi:hypothetical protein